MAIAECCIADPLIQRGALVDLSPWKAIPSRALLFGEAQGRAIVSTSDAEAVLAIAKKHGVPARMHRHGEASERRARDQGGARTACGRHWLDFSSAYHDAIPRAMRRAPAEQVSGNRSWGTLATGAPS